MTLWLQVPATTCEDVGGLEPVKAELQGLVRYPMMHPENFEKFGTGPRKGALHLLVVVVEGQRAGAQHRH